MGWTDGCGSVSGYQNPLRKLRELTCGKPLASSLRQLSPGGKLGRATGVCKLFARLAFLPLRRELMAALRSAAATQIDRPQAAMEGGRLRLGQSRGPCYPVTVPNSTTTQLR